MTGANYTEGFRAGFLRRNSGTVLELYAEKMIKKADGSDAGDIDVSYEITERCELKSLFPAHALVQVDDDVWLPKGSRLLVELTASKGETILATGQWRGTLIEP